MLVIWIWLLVFWPAVSFIRALIVTRLCCNWHASRADRSIQWDQIGRYKEEMAELGYEKPDLEMIPTERKHD